MPIEAEFIGRTYDDFLLRPGHAVVDSRRHVSLKSRLTRRIELELPVTSANMDSVTGPEMAKAMALEGGLGVVHRGMSIQVQLQAVRQLKRSQGYVVEQPLCLPQNASLDHARHFTRQHGISGILIETEESSRVLAGMLSHRDMPWTDTEGDRPVSEFMTPLERLHTAPPDIAVEDAKRLMFTHRIEKLPLVGPGATIAGLITRKDLISFRQRPYSTRDTKGRLMVAAAIGARGDYLERAQALIEAGADALVMDIAHAHSEVMKTAVGEFRRRFPDVDLVCGNVGTAEGARFLANLGADAIKVGIGPGRGCRTRLETGAGVPQLQAIREVWCELRDEIPIIADGGIRHDKDIFMAIALGAATVMLGSALAGTDEAPGHVIVDPATGEKRKLYRGMTSPQAVLQALYDVERDDVEEALETPAEGQETQIPYRGSVVMILNRIRGHLRSSVSYAGERDLASARAKIIGDPLGHLIVLSEAAQKESYQR